MIICSAITVILILHYQKIGISATTQFHHLLAPLAFSLTRFPMSVSFSYSMAGKSIMFTTSSALHLSMEGPKQGSCQVGLRSQKVHLQLKGQKRMYTKRRKDAYIHQIYTDMCVLDSVFLISIIRKLQAQGVCCISKFSQQHRNSCNNA